jgi:hypothetical protein
MGDIEYIATNYRHPDIKTGQHTNGPARIWIRVDSGPWYPTGSCSMWRVRDEIEINGPQRIIDGTWGGR